MHLRTLHRACLDVRHLGSRKPLLFDLAVVNGLMARAVLAKSIPFRSRAVNAYEPIPYNRDLRRYCGDFCGDPACILTNFATSRITLPQQANLLTWKGSQGFLPSVQPFS